MTPEILVTYFGDSRPHAKLLREWVRRYLETEPTLPARILSNAPVPGFGLETFVVDPSQFGELVRPRQPFDFKGTLILAAMLASRRPFLVMDADAFLLADVGPEVESFALEPLAIAPDNHGNRTFTLAGREIREGCAGVMVCGGTPQARIGRVFAYRAAWNAIEEERSESSEFLASLREQRAFSASATAVLPDSMNVSHRAKDQEGAKIIHHHGPK